jgi:hypothetical protein
MLRRIKKVPLCQSYQTTGHGAMRADDDLKMK